MKGNKIDCNDIPLRLKIAGLLLWLGGIGIGISLGGYISKIISGCGC